MNGWVRLTLTTFLAHARSGEEVSAKRTERGLRKAEALLSEALSPPEPALPSPSRLRRATSPPFHGGEEPKTQLNHSAKVRNPAPLNSRWIWSKSSLVRILPLSR